MVITATEIRRRAKAVDDRWNAWRRRQWKNNDEWGWIFRWDRACARSWRMLQNEPPSDGAVARFERRHKRLLVLVEKRAKREPHRPWWKLVFAERMRRC